MNNAIVLVLLSLLFNGCNDITFKKYSIKSRSKGMMIAGTGAVFGVWQLIYLTYFSTGISTDQLTVFYGLSTGLILLLANILLLECLTHLEISLGSTIYRLNTIGVLILSFLFLGEHIGIYKITAIALGIISVLLLYNPKETSSSKDIYTLFLVLIILGSILRASYGVLSKYAIINGANAQGMIPYTALCWVFGGLLYAFIKEKRFSMSKKMMIYMFLSGSLIFLTVATLIQAISLGDVSTLIPIANCSFIIALLLSVILKLEKLTIKKSIAIIIASCSIIMLSRL